MPIIWKCPSSSIPSIDEFIPPRCERCSRLTYFLHKKYVIKYSPSCPESGEIQFIDKLTGEKKWVDLDIKNPEYISSSVSLFVQKIVYITAHGTVMKSNSTHSEDIDAYVTSSVSKNALIIIAALFSWQ